MGKILFPNFKTLVVGYFALLASVPDNDNLAFRMQALARTFNWGFAFTARSRPSRPSALICNLER